MFMLESQRSPTFAFIFLAEERSNMPMDKSEKEEKEPKEECEQEDDEDNHEPADGEAANEGNAEFIAAQGRLYLLDN